MSRLNLGRPDGGDPLLTVRSAVIFLLALVVAAGVGALTSVASHDAAKALLTGVAAFAAGTYYGMKIIGRD